MSAAAQNAPAPADSFDQAYAAIRADGDIQFSTVAPPPPPPDAPQWWRDFLAWLGEVLQPLGQFLAANWPVIRIGLLVLLAAGVLFLLWVIIAPYIEDWRGKAPRPAEPEWRIDISAARQLLAEADALAAEGRYAEAAHLLLYRSIEDIQVKRPDLLRPSNTAREIGAFAALPDKARAMFAVIARHVERSLFGAKPLDAAGWSEARAAYGDFALAGNWR